MFWVILYLLRLAVKSVGVTLLPIKDDLSVGRSIGWSAGILLLEAAIWAIALEESAWLMGFHEYKWVVIYPVTFAVNGIIRLIFYATIALKYTDVKTEKL